MSNTNIYEKIEAIQSEIEAKQKEIVKLREGMAPIKIEDYALLDFENQPVHLSSLFDEKNELLIIHNMGKKCVYCTLWADGLNGIVKPLKDAVPFVLVSPDSPDIQKEFATSRNWNFPMLSARGTDFIEKMGFESKPNHYLPGVSVIVRQENGLFKTTHDFFGPGDKYCSLWHFLDLLPSKGDKWEPKYQYV